MKDSIITLNGKWVHVLFCDNVDNGESDGHYDESNKNGPIIRIDKSKPVESVVETLIHEILHAQLPDLSEDCVTRVGYETTKALYETGVIT